MSWFSSIFKPSLGGDADASSKDGFGIGDLIGLGSSLLGVYNSTSNNAAAQDQASKQWEAQFAYAKERDAINDAYRDKALAKGGGGGGGSGDAIKKKALEIQAYGNFGNQLSDQNATSLKAYQGLADGIAGPLAARKR
jgi:hypothetical protein